MATPEEIESRVANEGAVVLAIERELHLLGKEERDLQEALSGNFLAFPIDDAHDICRAAIQRALKDQPAANTTDILNSEAESPESPLRKLVRNWIHQVLHNTVLQG